MRRLSDECVRQRRAGQRRLGDTRVDAPGSDALLDRALALQFGVLRLDTAVTTLRLRRYGRLGALLVPPFDNPGEELGGGVRLQRADVTLPDRLDVYAVCGEQPLGIFVVGELDQGVVALRA